MTLHCPKCGSSRVRRGYTQPNLALRLFGYHDLLCDGCNLHYRAFAIPGTVPESSRRKAGRRRQAEANAAKFSETDPPPQPSLPSGRDAGESRSSTNPFAFLRYYVKLRLNVLLGGHRTPRPLGIVWRWRHWKQRRRR